MPFENGKKFFNFIYFIVEWWISVNHNAKDMQSSWSAAANNYFFYNKEVSEMAKKKAKKKTAKKKAGKKK